ncbi:hypothetical protein BURCENBC7_AP4497 [Burkholderia cenocepacia BC7]|nr:hypothetical protein BURCENK562V_C4936 [Burkholderia cenocepacia K56-2Valvano]ERI25794.1 hypothetical protein BURCENBC7_AP4497 [Burkholderia cenocepacia BC7]
MRASTSLETVAQGEFRSTLARLCRHDAGFTISPRPAGSPRRRALHAGYWFQLLCIPE